MTLALVWDTETTNLVRKDISLYHPDQPHLVQIAGVLIDSATGQEHSCMNFIVKPTFEGPMPQKSKDAHGFSRENCELMGVDLKVAVAAFTNLRAVADELVAHNHVFDRQIIEIALNRCKASPKHPGPSGGMQVCTMNENVTKFVGLPPTQRMRENGYGDKNKPPSLKELHEFLFGEGFSGAHNAMNDVRACARCFVELRKQQIL